MSTPFASIGGLASGLDTADIVRQLMQLERQPLRVLQQRADGYRRTDQAWSGVVAKLSGLRSAVDAFRDPQTVTSATQVSSSNDAVATVTRTGQPPTGSVSLTVDRLATAHRVAVGASFASADAQLDAGTITLTRGGEPWHTVELGEGATLTDASQALNALDGVSAQVVKTGPEAFRLVVSSADTGEANRFAVDTDIGALQTSDVLDLGEDARLMLGTLEITRSGNTVDDLLDGVSLQLTGTGDVTITTERDLDGAVDTVKGLVDQLNAVLSHLSDVSRTSTDAGARGPLANDTLVRSLAFQLRGALSQVVGEGEVRTLGHAGISLTRDGKVTLDEAALRGALEADPDGVTELLGRVAQPSDPRLEVPAVGRAEPGEYAVSITKAARIAAITGASYTPPAGDPKTFTITVDGKVVTVTVYEDDSIDAAVQRINDALAGADVSRLAARHGDGRLVVEATRAGSSGTFTVDGSGALGLDGTHEGQDAEGTISDGTETWDLSGTGRTLTVPEGPGNGLVLRVPVEVEAALGTVRVSDGLAGLLDRTLRAAEGSDGSIARARSSLESRIAATETSIDRFEDRLETRERVLRRQFTALESAMAKMATQANWLTAQLTAGMQQR